MDNQSIQHTRWNCTYYIVFIPKYRDMVILNSGSIVEHDCMIGDFTHIAPGAVLCGRVEIGSEAFIGANTTIANCRRIGKGSLIGAGSVVVKDIGEHKKAYGNPCREMDVY